LSVSGDDESDIRGTGLHYVVLVLSRTF
jgi:hypothetical protein